jgi:hypothetical protein
LVSNHVSPLIEEVEDAEAGIEDICMNEENNDEEEQGTTMIIKERQRN